MSSFKYITLALAAVLFVACNPGKREEEIRKQEAAKYQYKLDSMKLAEAEAKLAAAEAKANKAAAAADKERPVRSATVPNCEYSWLSHRRVTYDDIAGLSTEELGYLRNAIYAMHGRKFVKAKYRSYFSQFPWYTPLYTEVKLSRLEQENVEFIQRFE